jgi:UDP-N-acetylmuramoylalanine--D-glutamate ligase
MELSSFQLETTDSLYPAAAVVLNVSLDHMDRYPGFRDYLDAKQRIYLGANAVVVNREDPNTMPRRSSAETYTFGLDSPVGARDFGLVQDNGGHLLEAGKLKLTGRHNWANVLAGLALAKAVGWDPKRCAEAAARFRGLPHRMELVARIDGVRWVNDSKATNVGATVAALSGAGTPVVLIAGGDGKGADFTPLRAAVGQHARGLVLFGRDAPIIDEAIGEGVVAKYRAASLEQAVEQAFKLAEPGDTVLLSPACASFDMFSDYEQRGDAFRTAVRGLS